MKPSLTLCLITCLCLSFSGMAANERQQERHSERQKDRQQERQPSRAQGLQTEPRRMVVNGPEQAVAMAQRQFRGKVLSVQSSGSGYRVKILNNNGQVFSVSVDAASGRVSRN
ncbi:MAG: PepSY domain-containing protein [Shewanella sp.]|uniref:PepSY domain-containing protein n=1 Tax=Shewanella sp. TaxID=50422 RepID=UPI003F2EEDC2